MTRPRDYRVRVWGDGGVLIDGRDLCYMQDEGKQLPMQRPRCDAEHLNRALDDVCMDVANAMHALSDVMEAMKATDVDE